MHLFVSLGWSRYNLRTYILGTTFIFSLLHITVTLGSNSIHLHPDFPHHWSLTPIAEFHSPPPNFPPPSEFNSPRGVLLLSRYSSRARANMEHHSSKTLRRSSTWPMSSARRKKIMGCSSFDALGNRVSFRRQHGIDVPDFFAYEDESGTSTPESMPGTLCGFCGEEACDALYPLYLRDCITWCRLRGELTLYLKCASVSARRPSLGSERSAYVFS